MLRDFRKPTQKPSASALYGAVVERARAPAFFTLLGVRDSIDGRFDLLALHAFLVLDALERGGPHRRELSAALTDVIFAGLEEALREMGVGDFGLSRRMKAMANAFYGRLEAYRAASSETELAAALLRNLYRGAPNAHGEASAMARYAMSVRETLAKQDFHLGSADFGPLPLSQA